MQQENRATPLELWGGVECTVARVGDGYRDQLARSGHDGRLDDLDRFAAMGIRALRYPILWERHVHGDLDAIDWRWADERLERLRELGIRPIVGLCHHGGGPAFTSLLDPAFPDHLARFARLVAERYPWIDAYVPVNEPLTTARFAALYGHWHPHRRDTRSFLRVLLHECRAVALAMREIRAVNPGALLVQTEDIGHIFGTPAVAYQAEYENHRRWLSLDLLCGLVTPEHPLWMEIAAHGVTDRDLAPFRAVPCVPDIVGVNHYATSDRFLDERLERYPAQTHGPRPHPRYADIEAVRVVGEEGIGGVAGALRETWDRYALPMAITESHLGGTPEERVRWLWEGWRAAEAVRREGADVRAVTVWSLLGSFDWNSLLTRADGHYEPGAFDLRAPQPRPTAVVAVARALARGETPRHPLLGVAGWWRRPERLHFPPVDARGRDLPNAVWGAPAALGHPPRLLVIAGASPMSAALAEEVRVRADWRGIPMALVEHRALSRCDAGLLAAALAAHEPWAVIDAVVPDAWRDPARLPGPDGLAAWRGTIAAACARLGLPLLTWSVDRVFDGAKGAPYVESDRVAADSPAAAIDERVRAAHERALVLRTGPMLAPRERPPDRPARAWGAELVSPVYLPDLAQAALDLLVDGAEGLWHLVNPGALPAAELARLLAGNAPGDPGGGALPVAARLAESPRSWALDSERGWPLPPLDDALARFARSRA